MLVVSAGLFQLTPSRRATDAAEMAVTCCDISTHALTEGDVSRKYFCNRSPRISTHALTEGDLDEIAEQIGCCISTHALTEGDAQNIYDSISAGHFNSRPHGGRRGLPAIK